MTAATRADPTKDVPGLTDQDGNLDRPLMGDAWIVPAEVTLRGDSLMWRYPGPDETRRLGRPEPGMLERFLGLAGEGDDRILTYAQRWGVLSLCGHGRCRAHDLACLGNSPYSEPLAGWRQWAGRMYAILRIAHRLHDDHMGNRDGRADQSPGSSH